MAANDTLIFRVSLNAKIYRVLEVMADDSLYDLAGEIVKAFGFDFDHPFGYYSKLTGNYYRSPVKYELFAEMDDPPEDALGVSDTTAAEAFPEDKMKFLFLFDYGDQWAFRITRTGSGQKDKAAEYPRVLKSVGEAPEQYPAVEED